MAASSSSSSSSTAIQEMFLSACKNNDYMFVESSLKGLSEEGMKLLSNQIIIKQRILLDLSRVHTISPGALKKTPNKNRYSSLF